MSDSEVSARSPALEAGSASPNDRDSRDAPAANPDLDMDLSDNDKDAEESDLSDVDENEFADFDPNAVAVNETRPVEIDEDVARTLKATKRQKKDGEPKKPKEKKREKPKKKRGGDDSDDGADGQMLDGSRQRKPKSTRVRGGEEDKERARERKEQQMRDAQQDEENLTPEERRRRALDRAMDAALKNPNKRRKKKDEVDLEEAFDDEIAALKVRMENACRDDNDAREQGKPAIHKLKMLPEVVALLSRNTVQHSIVDPDTNFLQSVKFFLEPLNDGSLPAYNIQRDLFAALTRLPIEKEALRSSGIGKVVLYYTKSKRPEVAIKRTAERLMGDWSRPILKRSDDYKKRKIETREFDAQAAQLALRPSAIAASQSQAAASQRLPQSQREMERERMLKPAPYSNRARLDASAASYSVAPKSTYDPNRMDPASKPIGAGGDAAFRRMTAKIGKKRT